MKGPEKKKIIGASFNIYKKLDEKDRMDDFRDVMAIPGLDVIGLQEIIWDIIPHKHLPYDFAVHQAGGNAAKKDPILWRRFKREALDRGVQLLHEAVYQGDTMAPARSAHWIVFEDLIWINCHLNADVEGIPGHPKRDSPRPDANHKMLLRLIDLADRLQEQYGLPVFISGDFNVDFGSDKRVRNRKFPYVNLTRAGFKCCWDGRAEESTRNKPGKKGRTIDQVWARGSKTHKVKFTHAYTPNRWRKGDAVESDHLAVIVHAVIQQRIKPWLYDVLGKRR